MKSDVPGVGLVEHSLFTETRRREVRSSGTGCASIGLPYPPRLAILQSEAFHSSPE